MIFRSSVGILSATGGGAHERAEKFECDAGQDARAPGKSFFTTFALTIMARATPEDEKSASIVGAGFKPALRRKIVPIRLGNAAGQV